MQEAKIFQGDEVLQKTQRKFYKQQIKREQLKVAFKSVLTELIEKYMDNTWLPDYSDRDADINITANLLLREVSIRTPLK